MAKTVGTNPLTLPWPEDRFGFTVNFKKHGVNTVQRINGNKDKLELFLEVLRVLAKHATEKYEHAKSAHDAKLAAEEQRKSDAELEGRMLVAAAFGNVE